MSPLPACSIIPLPFSKMKINKVTGSHVQKSETGGQALSRLKVGQTVMASVVRRQGPHRALLDIRGSKIDATFKDGVPDVNRMKLLLEKAQGDRYVFRIEHGQGKSALREYIADVSVFHRDLISDSLLHSLGDKINSSTGKVESLYILNRLLHELISAKAVSKSSLSSLLNILLKKGVSPQDCAVFSFLFSRNMSILTEILNVLFRQFFQKQYLEEKGRWKLDSHRMEQAVGKVFDVLKNDPDAKVLVSMIYELLAGDGEEINGAALKELPVFDDENFTPARIVLNEDTILVSVDMSATGRVEVLINSVSERIKVNFYCHEHEGMNMLRSSQEELAQTLADRLQKKIEIWFFGPDEIKQKIIAINQNLLFTIGIDITV